jgi:hypothetical protein
MSYIKIMLKRVDAILPGDIIRTPREPGHYLFPAWAQAIGITVGDMSTTVVTLRPATTDGKVAEPGKIQQIGTTVPSWELVEVQTRITASGSAR